MMTELQQIKFLSEFSYWLRAILLQQRNCGWLVHFMSYTVFMKEESSTMLKMDGLATCENYPEKENFRSQSN